MKLRNIFITGLSVLALSACNDYLEVDAPSKNQPTDVFSDARAMERAINGVYASMLSDNMFGDKLINTFCRNSDVDFVTNSSQYTQSNKYCRFDCNPAGGELKNTWEALYHGIELCNLFIEGAESSPAYDKEDPDVDIIHMIGEAKVARAMFYHELIWLFGDVPFSAKSSQTTDTKIYPVTDRVQILDFLINDIKGVADMMKTPDKISEGVERISKYAAYGMITRLAMTAGGWYLAPDGDTYGKMTRSDNWQNYYTTAREYAVKVIDDPANPHKLSLPYYEVFYNECNNIVKNDDDVMFEIPFAKESTGNLGYIHGPKMDQYDGITPHPYGKASGSARLNAFYRFMFDEDDTRRDYVNQLFRYTSDGSDYTCVPELSFTTYNGKWSKLWVKGGLGNATEGATGINYPYLRYADVLLMCAEADCGLNNGNATALSRRCLEQVRMRAFRETNEMKVYSYDESNFLKTILDERKFEFAGENMRWRDLVRNDMYNLEVMWTFYRYYYKADDSDLSDVAVHDFGEGNEDVYENLPALLINVHTYSNLFDRDVTINGVTYARKGDKILDERRFPNTEMKICWILNPYDKTPNPTKKEWQDLFRNIKKDDWKEEALFEWTDGEGEIRNEIRYSLRGYIFMDELGTVKWIRNGEEEIAPLPSADMTSRDIPVLRYILPYPSDVIARSQGKYVNKYKYSDQ